MASERAPSKSPLRPIDANGDAQPAAASPSRLKTQPAGAETLITQFSGFRVSDPSSEGDQADRPLSATAKPTHSKDRAISDALSAFFEDQRPSSGSTPSAAFQHNVTGHPKKMASFRKQKAGAIFNDRKFRPEHHRDHRINVPAVPTFEDKKPNPPMLFNSIAPADPSLYGALDDAGEVEFYTDPAKASADLQALLEGGMEEQDDPEKVEDQDTAADMAGGNNPSGLTVGLLPHQVEGVSWMHGRELGPVKRGKVPKGGILADDMGLGKTLQTISLILKNQKPEKGEKGWKAHFDDIEKTTLVVAPLALIRQWEAEIKSKIAKSHTLKVCVHHGPQRTKRFRDLARYDVVVTTYQVLVSEFGHSSGPNGNLQAGCFGLHWWRVVLDEAHTIKNRNAKSTKACYALRSEYRWCLTGTPMQNNLEELQSLIKFLRVKPYDNLSEWKAQIENPMKNGKGHVAIRRLHSILRCFMKRRTKAILREEGALDSTDKPTGGGLQAPTGFKVTERKVVTVSSKLSPAERRFYERMEARADRSIERMMRGDMNYANALVLLLRLRQVCNHPKLIEGKLDKDKEALATDSASKKDPAVPDVDSLADMFGGMGIATKTCHVCGQDLPRTKLPNEGSQDTCDACHDDLAYFKGHKRGKRGKKARRKETLDKATEASRDEFTAPGSKSKQRRPRPGARPTVLDSDDDEGDDANQGPGHDTGKRHSNEPDSGFLSASEEAFEKNEDESDDSIASLSAILSQSQQLQVSMNGKVQGQRSSQLSDSGDGSSRSENDSEDGTSQSEDDSEIDGSDDNSGGVMASAKIREIVEILRREIREHKFIVFSQFTSMMDLIEPFFRNEGFKFTRYDGSMRNEEREASLHRLRHDPKTRILLCSLKCGSLGLNLTAATRVIIVEPFWNPFVEEQAIDRVHRLTQTIDVVVYKLTVEKTVEQRIVELQEKKRLLAETAIEGGMKKDNMKLGFKEIMDLFRRDTSSDHHQNGGIQDRAYGYDASTGRNREFTNLEQISSDLAALRSKPVRKKTQQKEDTIYGRRW